MMQTQGRTKNMGYYYNFPQLPYLQRIFSVWKVAKHSKTIRKVEKTILKNSFSENKFSV